MKATVSQKGQITIPKSCRDQLGIKTGAILEAQAINGTLVGRRVQMQDGIHKWRGKGRLPGGARNVDDYLAQIRE